MTFENGPKERLNGQINIPADKSISQRVAIFSLLHDGVSEIYNYSPAADPQSALACVEALGAKVERFDDHIKITGTGRDGINKGPVTLDCGNSGTAMRLLSGLVAGAGVEATLIGDESLSARTMKRVINPLREMGANIEARDDDFAPLRFKGGKSLKPIDFELPVASAQLKSCILIAALFNKSDSVVLEPLMCRDHTERLLDLKVEEHQLPFGVGRSITANAKVEIPPMSGTVPADFSAAAFWLAAASIHPNASLNLPKVGMNPTRNAMVEVLKRMQANISFDNWSAQGKEQLADIKIETSNLKATTILKEEVPILIDEIPALAVTMAFAEGTSEIRGAEELRHKETDRIEAVAQMLRKANVKFDEHNDGFTIYGNPDHSFEACSFESYHDHRIAMSAAVLALKADGPCQIVGGDCATISYPNFWEDWKTI